MKKYRFYSFVNHIYMSPLQWGIQTAHCVSTMMAKAAMAKGEKGEQEREQVMAWAQEEPTIIVYEGGNVATLLDLERDLGALSARLGLPFAAFREDQASLGGVITAVSVLVPEEYFSLSLERDAEGKMQFSLPLIDPPEVRAPAGGLPVTLRSNPALHTFLSILKAAKFAGS